MYRSFTIIWTCSQLGCGQDVHHQIMYRSFTIIMIIWTCSQLGCGQDVHHQIMYRSFTIIWTCSQLGCGQDVHHQIMYRSFTIIWTCSQLGCGQDVHHQIMYRLLPNRSWKHCCLADKSPNWPLLLDVRRCLNEEICCVAKHNTFCPLQIVDKLLGEELNTSAVRVMTKP